MEVERIDIKQFDLANEKVKHSIELFIEMGDNYFLYRGRYHGSVPLSDDQEDHSLGWKEQYSNFHIKIKRQSIVSLEYKWVEARELWMIEIESNGYPNSIHLQFKTEKEMQVVFKKLDKFIFR